MAPFPPPRLRAAVHGYSLIELLAVVAILSALAGLTVGSLSPVKANALTAGGNQIADLLATARQNSLSHHSFTAVIIKSSGDKRYSAHCLFELSRNDDGNFAGWKILAPWRPLPEGIRFDNTESAADFLATANSRTGVANEKLPNAVLFRGKPLDLASNSDVRVQIFQPDGTLAGEKLLRVRLVEAAEDTANAIIYTGQKTAGQPANYYDVVILRETGQVKVERR